jgi:hypothetical protein
MARGKETFADACARPEESDTPAGKGAEIGEGVGAIDSKGGFARPCLVLGASGASAGGAIDV